ncbi:MAG: hypothetical protein ABJD53_17990 [Gammaproteobacteria bacterium]
MRGVHRWVAASFGLLFIIISVVIVYASAPAPGWAVYLTALVIGLLGLDAVISAVRKRRSLLSLIGPLP